jgi:5-formyltetrahydrofolate cyclo-ligase
VADEKKYLREVLGECRKALPTAYAGAVSRQVQGRVIESEVYRAASTIILYAAKDNEVSTDLLLDDALASNRSVLLPKIISEISQLALVRISSRAELIRCTFGILEPAGREIVPLTDLGPALFCVPGLAFGPGGQRLGRGGGYFDRTLGTRGPEVVTAGLAYSFQLLDQLPQSLNDRRLNLIFTESATHGGQGLCRSWLNRSCSR